MIDKAYIDKIDARVSDIESELSNPALASNQKKFRQRMEEHSRLKKIQFKAERYFTLLDQKADAESILADSESDSELREMAQEDILEADEHAPAAERDLMVSLLPPRPEDSRNTIIEIRAGTGGDEAALFAADLFRMYIRFAENKGWKTRVIDANASNIGGYKEIVFSVEGENVYRTLRYESGVHRVQRIPVTETSGRIHTSAATVAILPEVAELDEVVIKSEDLRIDVYRASGAGGQHVNTTDSAVRITHIPTGTIVQSQDERSQHRNKEIAMRVLSARIMDQQRQEEASKYAEERRSMVGSGDRSERIRTYNYPQNRVTDHRINLTPYSLDRIVEGDINAMVEALCEHDIQERLEKEMK